MRWLQRLPLTWKTALVIAVAVLSLLGFWGFSHVAITSTRAALATQERLITITRAVAEVEINLLDAKAELRNYLLSGQPEYRRRLDRALIRRQDRIQELKLLLAHAPEQLRRIQRLDSLMADWYTIYARPLLERFEVGAPVDLVQLGVGGEAHIEETGVLLREIRATQEQVTAAMVARTHDLLAMNTRRNVSLTILSTLLMVVSLARISRQIQRGIRTLQQGAEAIAAGRVERIDDPGGAAEFYVMAEDLNRLASALLAQKEELRAQHEELIAQNELLIHQQEEMSEIQAVVEAERDQAASLNRLQRLLHEQSSVETLCQALLETMLEKGEAQVGAVLLVDERGGARIAASVALTAAAASLDRLTGFMVEALRKGESIAHSYPESLLRFPVYTAEIPVGHELYLPITDGRPLGVIVLGRTADRPFTEEEQRWLRIFNSAAGAVLANRLSFYEAKQQRDLFRHVLDSINEGILLIRSDGGLVFNRRYFELVGVPVPPPDATIDQIDPLLSERTRGSAVFAELAERAKAEPLAPLSGRMELTGLPGRVIDFYAVALVDENGVKTGRLNVVRDVSHEATIDRMKSEFLSTISHELRTPLTSIRGYAELLLEEDLGPVPPEQKECLSVIRENSLHLSGLINDLLEIEKLQQGKIELYLEQVDLNAVLGRTVRSAEPQARQKGLDLRLEAGALPPVRGDEGRLIQVMNNLLSNAIKYTKAGEVRVLARQEGDAVRIEVADTGIGIAPEAIEKLFTRFFRIDNAYTREVGGVGLGLVITKELVELHGGRIEVASAVGQGTRFTVYLPLGRP